MEFVESLIDFANKAIGEAVGKVDNLRVSAIALQLGAPERLVRAAIEAGCKSTEEIEKWLDDI